MIVLNVAWMRIARLSSWRLSAFSGRSHERSSMVTHPRRGLGPSCHPASVLQHVLSAGWGRGSRRGRPLVEHVRLAFLVTGAVPELDGHEAATLVEAAGARVALEG